MFDLSVVIPVFNAEATIEAVAQGLIKAFGPHGLLQIVLVNDGSKDKTHQVCLRLSEKLPECISYIRLAKNFGEHNAVMAGLRRARGAYIVIMDDDMQNLPEDAIRLFRQAKENGFDIVYSVYPQKQHNLARNLGSRFNGWVANLLIDKPQQLYLSSFKALSSWLVEEIIKYKGPYPYIDGLALRCTRNIGMIEVSHQPRSQGQSGYNLKKLIGLWLNMFVNFSILPLRASTCLGFASVLLAMLIIAGMIVEKISGGNAPPGFAYLVVITMTFAGAQLLMLGVLGEYLGRLYLASNETPQYVVRESFGAGSQKRTADHA